MPRARANSRDLKLGRSRRDVWAVLPSELPFALFGENCLGQAGNGKGVPLAQQDGSHDRHQNCDGKILSEFHAKPTRVMVGSYELDTDGRRDQSVHPVEKIPAQQCVGSHRPEANAAESQRNQRDDDQRIEGDSR